MPNKRIIFTHGCMKCELLWTHPDCDRDFLVKNQLCPNCGGPLESSLRERLYSNSFDAYVQEVLDETTKSR